jgi:hypothetical protein
VPGNQGCECVVVLCELSQQGALRDTGRRYAMKQLRHEHPVCADHARRHNGLELFVLARAARHRGGPLETRLAADE